MHEAFNEIYFEILSRYERVQRSADAQGPGAISLQLPIRDPYDVVVDILKHGIEDLPGRRQLRGDGLLFLVINLHQLVALPLSHGKSPTPIHRDVVDGLRDDVRKILRASAAVAGDRNLITAGHVLRGTVEVLDQLTLKSWRLWD